MKTKELISNFFTFRVIFSLFLITVLFPIAWDAVENNDVNKIIDLLEMFVMVSATLAILSSHPPARQSLGAGGDPGSRAPEPYGGAGGMTKAGDFKYNRGPRAIMLIAQIK